MSALPKVLIVDDQPRNLDALEAMLEPSGCALVRAGSADEALLKLLREDFAAIVLDIRMPGMNGLELAALIKQRKRSQHVPILFLTAHMLNEEDVLKGYGAGAVDYLTKPVNATILRSKIDVFIDLFRKTRALADVNDRLQTEVGERENAQRALQAANEDLERRVRERTAALARAHRETLEDEERWLMAMDVAQIAAWEWILSTGQMTWSSDPEMLFGFESGAFGTDRRMFRALHADDAVRVERAVATALESGKYEAEYRLVRPGGGVVWITERGRVVLDGEGRPERIVGISRDVTLEHDAKLERERLLKSAREARDEAERQSRLKDDFLATLSHELRTPMNVILGWLSILSSGKPVRDLESALALIQRNAQLQAKLIDDLLDVNRLVSGNLILDVAPVELEDIVRSAMLGLRPAADAKRIELTLSAQSPCLQILADGRRLQQVFWNLLHNAIKFTSNDGRIQTRIDHVGPSAHITVTDNGRGIASAFLPYVFDRFRQEDSSTTRECFGLGLGLSIAKHLVELHGGTVGAWSDGRGRGATFTVRLPVMAVDRPHETRIIDDTDVLARVNREV